MNKGTSNDLAVASRFDERQAAEDIRHAYDSTTATERDYLTKIIVFGLMLEHTKAQLGHGDFRVWLRGNCFPEVEDASFESARRKMDRWRETARSSCALLQIGHDVLFDGRPLHVVLQLPAEHLATEARDVQAQILNFLEGNTQHAIQMEFKNLLAQSGGFRPSKTQLNAWLKKHHPDLIGTPFDDLPAGIQNKFRKWLQAEGKNIDPKKALAARYQMIRETLLDHLASIATINNLTPDDLALYEEHDKLKERLPDQILEAHIAYNNARRKQKGSR